jgi:hypothetical protein
MNRILGLLVVSALVVSGCSAPTPQSVPAAANSQQSVLPDQQAVGGTTDATALAKKRWWPKPGLSWQIQYSGKLAATSAQVVDLDGVETTKAQVSKLHAQGKKVICYFNAGGYENWRPDRKKFAKSLLGKALDGWAGERWLDVRKLKKLMPIMTARINQCKAKGFDAVDPDNMDGYQTRTGFPLKKAHALAYLRALSKVAHARGLSIGLKNSTDLIKQAAPSVEFAVNEECLAYNECSAYAPLLKARKAVFHVEYSGTISTICARVPSGFSTVRKHLSLDAWAQYC